jgi:hypothetical protein
MDQRANREPLPTDQGTRDAFAAKLSPDGADLVYSTYLGGSDADML